MIALSAQGHGHDTICAWKLTSYTLESKYEIA